VLLCRPQQSDIPIFCGKLASRDLFAFGCGSISGQSSLTTFQIVQPANPGSTCSAHASKDGGIQCMAGPHCRANHAFVLMDTAVPIPSLLSERQERLDRLRSSRGNHHPTGQLMGSWSRAPNMRLKLPGAHK